MTDKDFMTTSASLLSQIAQNVSDERAAKFGYDILMGLSTTSNQTAAKRFNAWVGWWNIRQKHLEQFGGVWVPAIPLTLEDVK